MLELVKLSIFIIVLSLFKISGRVKDAADINKLGYDAIVLGSDSIFNLKHPLCNSLYYVLPSLIAREYKTLIPNGC